MQSSSIGLCVLIWLAAIVMVLASTPAIAQRIATDNTAAATSSRKIFDSNSAIRTYPLQSEKYRLAKANLLAGHYNKYVQELEKYGSEGDMQCLDELANLYYEGRIVGQDSKRAFDIWQDLTAKSYGPAICGLAVMYLNGFACSKDFAKALSLFSQASALGCDFGPFGIAHMCSEGRGCKTDYAKALALYEQLCTKDSPLGWYGKSKLLWDGLGTKENTAESMELLQRAAEAGLPQAQARLASLYSSGGKVPANHKLARFWAQRGSDQGNVSCQLQLADCKMKGLGGEKDCVGGIRLLKALADQSILEAENRLGHEYRVGQCVKKDLVAAKMWLEKAADRVYVNSLNELADMYFTGDGVPKNVEKWFELNMKAASQGTASNRDRSSCYYNVGFAYDFGYGVKKDLNQARIWYAKAAAAGNPHACNNLSLMYQDGRGCPVNKDLAMSLRKEGAKNGCWMACINLAQNYTYGTNGVIRNIAEAIRLFNKSVELHGANQTANYELGRIYEKGLAGKIDLKLADRYYQEAAKYGCEAAIKKTTDEKVLSFNNLVAPPKHRSAYVIYDIDPRKAKYFVHVPKSITSKQRFGLIVYIDTSDRATALPAGWAQVLAKRHLLFVCPQNAGNSCGSYQRAGLALLGALEMMRKYNIDKNRVYVAGTLGGARLASDLGFNQSDVFCGTIQSCGSDFYRKVQKRYPTTKEKIGDEYGLCEASAAEIASARKKVKFALITGKDDFRRANVLNIYHEGFAKEGFRSKLFEVDSIGLNDCDSKTLEGALSWLDSAN